MTVIRRETGAPCHENNSATQMAVNRIRPIPQRPGLALAQKHPQVRCVFFSHRANFAAHEKASDYRIRQTPRRPERPAQKPNDILVSPSSMTGIEPRRGEFEQIEGNSVVCLLARGVSIASRNVYWRACSGCVRRRSLALRIKIRFINRRSAISAALDRPLCLNPIGWDETFLCRFF